MHKLLAAVTVLAVSTAQADSIVVDDDNPPWMFVPGAADPVDIQVASARGHRQLAAAVQVQDLRPVRSLPSGSSILFVDDDAALAGDGSSWAMAYRYLQDALANAVEGTEIRVAEGTYKPDQDEAGNVTPADREAAFELIGGVSIRGGFAGIGAVDPDERDVVAFESILSGDLLGDDGPEFLNNEENSGNVLRAGNISAVLLSGFTVASGNANGPDDFFNQSGGGLAASHSSLAVTQCTFRDNSANGGGGAILLSNLNSGLPVTLTMAECTLEHNRSPAGPGGGGAALLVFDAHATLSHCEIRDNTTSSICGGVASAAFGDPTEFTLVNCSISGNSAQFGGGVVVQNVEANLVSCVISGNEALGADAAVAGGGILMFGATLHVSNTLITGNFAQATGGGIKAGDELTVVNCTISGNSAGEAGAGIEAVFTENLFVHNSILWDNTIAGVADEPAQINVEGTKGVSVAFCAIQGLTGALGGTGNIDADPQFVDPDNGDFRLSLNSPCIDTGDNSAVPLGILRDLDGNPRFVADACAGDSGATVDMGAYEFQGTSCDLSNVMQMLASWGPCDDCGSCRYDFDGDCSVGILDLLVLLGNWG